MFEGLEARVRVRAEQMARRRAALLAEQLKAEVPAGIAVEAADEDVRLSGRKLMRRFVMDRGLRWLIPGAAT